MHVFGQNGASPDGRLRFLNEGCKAASHCSRLQSGKNNGRITEGILSGAALLSVVRSVGDGSPSIGRSRGPEAEQLPRADKIRLGAARIVRQPESVRSENDVISQNHPPLPV